MKTFSCNFGGGVSCSFEVDEEPPKPGETHVKTMAWTGEKKQKHFRPYIHWMNSINKQLADEWGQSILYAYVLRPGEIEAWCFEPGKAPVKVPNDSSWPK